MAHREELIRLLEKRGHERREEPFQLSSGEMSYDYVDGKRAICDGDGLRLAAKAIIELVEAAGLTFTAVGGLTMGADPIAHAVAYETGCRWFSVRKSAKKHGKQKLIEGCELEPADRVLLVDDVVTSGDSILQALDAIESVGASVAMAVALVDRGPLTAQKLTNRGVPYAPVATHDDLGMEPVVGGPADPAPDRS